jgi:hypothetical protein
VEIIIKIWQFGKKKFFKIWQFGQFVPGAGINHFLIA